MNLEITTEKVEPKVRKFDIGRVPVCSKCGKSLLQCKPNTKCCGETITLRRYVEEIRKEKFNPEQWVIKEETINAVTGIDLNAELVSIIGDNKCAE